jgi:5-methylcytosine-specific restriction protein B
MEITPDLFEVNKLSEHIQKSLDQCFAHLNIITEPPESEKLGEIEKDIIPNFISTIKGYLKFKETDIRRFIVSLLTKPFIILTGNSGTGKTKIAHTFAKWISQNMESRFALVPVGSDWTDNRNLIGFLNLLRRDSDSGNGIFQTTPVLDLTLSALNDPLHPYFLILDEMNLSHVERYFSDYLSSMESMESIPIHNEESVIYTSSGKKIMNKIKFPANLYVIGTVNIDETTYMFSPKVLDRANVIEFQVESKQFVSFLSNPFDLSGKIEVAPDLAAESFLNLSYRARGIALEDQTLQILEDPPDIENIKKYLESFFDLLGQRSMEFAFRTANEILRYVRVDYQLSANKTSWDWRDCLDIQVLQKILPKLHGSRRKLEAMLIALAAFCESGKLSDAKEYLKSTANLNTYSSDTEKKSEEILFSLSHKKLTNMIDSIRRDQFVSFIQ